MHSERLPGPKSFVLAVLNALRAILGDPEAFGDGVLKKTASSLAAVAANQLAKLQHIQRQPLFMVVVSENQFPVGDSLTDNP